MAWHLVDGLPLPDLVAGHPALDFCNTRAGWGTPAPKEYLTSDRALRLWCAEASLLPWPDDAGDPGAGGAVLERALTLRTALRDVALGLDDDAAWDLVTGEAAAARAACRLVRRAAAPARWVLPADTVDAPVLAVAAVADDLLTGPLADCVAACPGAGCGWLFADPRHRRRWCTMAICGNRAKARRHAERRRSVAAPVPAGDGT